MVNAVWLTLDDKSGGAATARGDLPLCNGFVIKQNY
jgi:hypothetical protein